MSCLLYHVRRSAALLALLTPLLLCKPPAALAFDLFARHEVSVQFATADGKPLADAEVRVFAPGDPTHVVRTGRTDSDGKYEFPADRDGLWTAEAHTAAEVARATVRVGKPGGEGTEPVSPYYLIAGLALLLALAVAYRVALGRRGGGRR